MTLLSDRALVGGKRLKNRFRGGVGSVDLSLPGAGFLILACCTDFPVLFIAPPPMI